MQADLWGPGLSAKSKVPKLLFTIALNDEKLHLMGHETGVSDTKAITIVLSCACLLLPESNEVSQGLLDI